MPGPPLHRVRRLSLQRARPLRALLLPVLRRADRRASSRRGRGRVGGHEAASRRPRSATRCTCFWSRSTWRLRARLKATSSRQQFAISIPRRPTTRSRGSAASSPRIASRSSPRVWARSTERGIERALRLRAGRRPAARPSRRSPPGRRTGVRPRLQDELARGGHSRGDRRARLSAAAARVCPGLLPRRGRRGRGRLPLPRAARCGRHADVHPRGVAPSSRPSCRAAIAAIHEGAFRPTPSEFVCADCPALDVVCAGPRLRGAAAAPVPAAVAAG